MDFAAARRAMIDSQLRPQAVTDPLVIAAMASVPREQFVAAESRSLAYIDRNLPLGGGRAMSPPATTGRMLTELAPRPGERALVVGALTGYTAAVLAEMGLEVTALESDGALFGQLSAVPGIRAERGELVDGVPAGAPYEVIVIDGAVEMIPEAIVEQLAPGGRLGTCLFEGGVQRLVIGRRTQHGFGTKSFADAASPALPAFSRPRVFTF
ncbi:protein-L-isoaspartate O-methyltransferase family protein [Sphingomonas arenae]|uniref:protein-L-isoaspartate O-methyltransferase family protein n=1 Tax=Sphingomonas arenae TaxID=2812555 RepID=UPI001967A7A6|nr:protein-L-isoaspartate O-methyltransferase [Sphingomonas arenae]